MHVLFSIYIYVSKGRTAFEFHNNLDRKKKYSGKEITAYAVSWLKTVKREQCSC